jgi:hypothetical protein
MAVGPEVVANELTGLAKRVYATGVVDQEQRLAITYEKLGEKSWNPAGAGWVGDAHLERSSSWKFSNPTEPIAEETTETSQQFTITTKQMDGNSTFTKDFMVKLVGGQTSFADYTYKLDDLRKSMAKNQNQACYIGPTMIRTTVAANAGPATTFTVVNNQYLFIGEYIDITNASDVIQIANAKITLISGTTITVDQTVTVTSGWRIYHRQEDLNPGTGKGLASLAQICDDTTSYNATFENISRTTYPQWRGIRSDQSGNPLSNDVLQAGQNLILTTSGLDYMTGSYMNFVHPDSVRRYLNIVLPQKRYIDASKYDSGMEKPDMLEWNGRGIVVDPDCGKRDWYMINTDHVGKMELYPLGLESAFGGSNMKWKSGYMQGTSLFYYSGQVGADRCNCNLLITNLQAL